MKKTKLMHKIAIVISTLIITTQFNISMTVKAIENNVHIQQNFNVENNIKDINEENKNTLKSNKNLELDKRINEKNSINNEIKKSQEKDEQNGNRWSLVDGKWYYINNLGEKHKGWLNLNETWYYLKPDTGVMQSGWQNIDGYKYYFNSSGDMAKGWVKYNGEYYYFGQDGSMKTGWINDGWTDYFLKSDGTIHKGWLNDGLNKYYMDENGQMRKGWVNNNGEYYYFGQDGAMRTGWINDGWTDYFLKSDGTIYKGWLNDGLNKYYMDENGQMRKGWVNDNREYYYFGQDGAMRTGWINDGYAYYFMNTNGIMRKGWLDEGKSKYYLGDNGDMKIGWQKITEKWYFFENSGVMATNKTIGNWYVDANGVGKELLKEIVYGKSGYGRDLKAYQIGNGKKVLMLVFEVHGYEDAWDKDGEELVKIANYTVDKLKEYYKSNNLNDWQIHIIPSANPDGIIDGWTNNGPGRTTVKHKIDLNRTFPVSFKPYYNSRNYTGSSPLGAPEARYLYDYIGNTMKWSNEKVAVDVHGWLNETIGNYQVGKYFGEQFDLPHKSSYGSGYLTTWTNSIGAKSVLVELPMPRSAVDIQKRKYKEKFYKSVVNLIKNM